MSRTPRVFFAILLALSAPRGALASLLDDAERAYASGDREEAGRAVRLFASEQPDSKRQLRVVALLARTAVDPSEAVAHWDDVLGLEPPGELAAEAHWMKGLQAYSAGLYVAAGQAFDVLAHGSSTRFPRARALLWKGLASLAADEPEAALASLEQATGSVGGDDAPALDLALASAHFRMGHIAEALHRYERFEREHRRDARASAAARRTVECLRLLGRETEASARAVRIERDYPTSSEATLAREAVRARRGGTPAAPPTAGAVRFIVQVAALSDPANATRLAQQVRSLALGEVSVEKVDGPDGVVHRVLVGPFDDEVRAHAAADSITTLGDVDPRVRQEPKR